ncbi:MAG: Maf family protein [Cellvibrionaceae bacterium]
MPSIVLASSSPYRRQLLEKLGVYFSHASPDIDESPRPNEAPQALTERLSNAKAEALSTQHPNSLIIGSDQVAELNGTLLGKPGTRENAIAQLQLCSAQTVSFHTGICLLNSATGHYHYDCDTYTVIFRELTDTQIAYYVDREQPFDCAGSFKSEGLGISLFSAIRGDDPNSLIGLPLIK